MNKLSINTYIKTDRKILWLIGISIFIKVLLLPFAQTVDADAVTRTFIAEQWIKNPVWITKNIWGPFHFYLTGITLAIWNNPIYAPILLNIILSTLSILPFYCLVKREFNADGAFVASCVYAISPIIFRNSLMNMSETPYLFFTVLALNFLSRGFKTRHSLDFLLAGSCFTIDAGFRFEAWFFIAIVIPVILFKKEKKNCLLFFLAAMLYPTADMLIHYIQDNHSINGFFSSYPWDFNSKHAADTVSFKDYLRRFWFIPFCWFISIGPFAFFVIKDLFSSLKKNQSYSWIVMLFWAFFLLAEAAAHRNAIILHSRFSLTLTLLSIPLIAIHYKELSPIKIRRAILFCVLTVALTYVYNFGNISPVPRLEDQNGDRVSTLIQKSITDKSSLIIDFWEWQNTYYIALQSKLPPENIYMISGDVKNIVPAEEIDAKIQKYPQGIILLVKNSALWKNASINNKELRFTFSNKVLDIEEVYSDDNILVIKYNRNG